MSCSGIDEDYSISGLPPIPIQNKAVTWNGREVQVLDPSHNLIGKGVTIPVIPDHTDDTSFFQRIFEDLTQLDLTENELDQIIGSSNEWILCEAWDFVETNYREDLTVEELLELRGLMFDTEFGRNIMCKSVWKRIEHGLRKGKHEVGKAAKKTGEKS